MKPEEAWSRPELFHSSKGSIGMISIPNPDNKFLSNAIQFTRQKSKSNDFVYKFKNKNVLF